MKKTLLSVLLVGLLGCSGGTSESGGDATPLHDGAHGADASVMDHDGHSDDAAPGADAVAAHDGSAAAQDVALGPGDGTSAADAAPSTPDAGLSPGDTSTPAAPDAALADVGDEPLPEGLHGEIPQDTIPVPEFVATNQNGEARGPEDLIGQPTVLWFFPFAGTPG